jgi:hypothetical protein
MTQRHDFRRVVALVAAAAVGFFVPALGIAGVPVELWTVYIAAAGAAGLLIAAAFEIGGRDPRLSLLAGLGNALIVALLGHLYRGFFNEIGLLFALVVAAHAVIHGLRPALLVAAMGSILVPLVVQAGEPINASDPVYAFIYLSGAALVPWTAERLAQRRLLALRDQLALTLSTEREAVMILARAAEAKDQVTGDHVVRVGDISATIGARIGLSEVHAEDLRFAGMLHDVGKLHVPDEILLKPGRLSPSEWDIVRRHTIWGERILGSSAGFEMARRICRSHHENWDGSGYPDGLRADRIPLEARIVRLADAFDAMRNPRPYKDAWPLERCLDMIERGAGTLFDPELARELLALYGPAGAASEMTLAQLIELPVGTHAGAIGRSRRRPPATARA